MRYPDTSLPDCWTDDLLDMVVQLKPFGRISHLLIQAPQQMEWRSYWRIDASINQGLVRMVLLTSHDHRYHVMLSYEMLRDLCEPKD